MVPRTELAVGLCSSVGGLADAVAVAFAKSPLYATRELSLVDLAVGDGPKARDVEVVLADPGLCAPVLDALPNLQWLQSTWAGVNVLSAHPRRGYTCTRLAGCFGPQMSEFVMGAVLSEDWRRLQECQERREWAPERFKGRRRCSSMTMGFLGVGDIASTIASRAKAFGMSTVAFATRAREEPNFDRVSTDLGAVLREADVVVNVLPSTAATRGLLDGDAWRSCGTAGKMFINVGRGDVVSEESLLTALAAGHLSVAVLDVFAIEPLPASSALWGHPSVRIAPHVSGISHPEDVAELFVRNLGRWLAAEPLEYVVDLDRGY